LGAPSRSDVRAANISTQVRALPKNSGYYEWSKDVRARFAAGDDKMLSMKKLIPAVAAAPSEVSALRDSVRVLSEVVRHLAERIEVLETRETLRGFRPVEG
jgi:hypothetical protein